MAEEDRSADIESSGEAKDSDDDDSANNDESPNKAKESGSNESSSDESTSKRFIFQMIAAATGIATLLVNSYLTYQSNENSKKAAELSQRKYDEQNLIQYSLNYDGPQVTDISPYSRDPKLQVARVGVLVQNTGERNLRGCLMMYEFVKDDLTPDIYLSNVNELGARSWQLKPGENHEATVESLLPPADVRQKVLIELWSECTNPQGASNSVFVRVDRGANTVTEDSLMVRVKPLDPVERYEAQQRVFGGPPVSKPSG